MIIDVHGHVIAPREVYAYREILVGTRGHYGRGSEDEELSEAMDGKHLGRFDLEEIRESGARHVRLLDEVGTDVQLVSARPYGLMHSEKPGRIVHWWAETINDVISTQAEMFPGRLAPIANLPQVWGDPVSVTFDELDRCVNRLGAVGVLINPDPSEGQDFVPGLGDEYWYPLYEKLVEYDLPMLVHSCGCVNERENQSMKFINEESNAILSLILHQTWKTFPKLKVVIPHGGGSMPYQFSRFSGFFWGMQGLPGTFLENLRNMYFDCTLYDPLSVEMLIKVVGPDRVLIGTERPGDGSNRTGAGGYPIDDLKSVVRDIEWLNDDDRQLIYEDNARRLFTRLAVPAETKS